MPVRRQASRILRNISLVAQVRHIAAALTLRIAIVISLLTPLHPAAAQTWTRLAHNPPGAISLMLLLSDGTVMAAGNNGSTIGRAWYKLTPDVHGSYINGNWTTLASTIDTRLYYSSQVLMDGRVMVAGGEYGTGTAKAEVYNPLNNTWTAVNPPTTLLDPTQPSPLNGSSQKIYDANSEILPDGKVLIAPVLPKVLGQPLIYDPSTNTWAAGPLYFRGVYQDEASWVKLPDDSILTIDPFGTNSERYIPSSNTWVDDGIVPVSLYDPFGKELGGAVLLPSGKAFYLGSTGHTAIYTPSGSVAPGAWAAGPDIPGSHGTPDAPCAMMVNGKVLCAVSPVPTSGTHFPTPTTFYEYDYVTNAFTAAPAPVGASDPIPTYQTVMLCLPDGSVLYSHMSTSVYIYTPAGPPLAAGKPTIISVTQNPDGSFHVTGTGLNGISEGASYGDDVQMNSNYPLVRLSDGGGNVYYARTYNWSSTSVMTGNQALSTEYRLPAGLPPGQYSVVVVGNGFASDPATAPSINVQPAPQTTCAGGSLQFSVTATGTGPLVYRWRRGITPLNNGGNVSGADTSTLTLSPVTPQDAGSDYNCLVTNVFGIATSSNAAASVCYANCDCSTEPPILNVNDFACFLNRFAAGDPAANCDASTAPPILNVNDFSCFLNAFAAGCP